MDPSLMAAIDNNNLPGHQDPEEDEDSFSPLEPFHSDEGDEMDMDDPPRGISRNYPELIEDEDDDQEHTYGRKRPSRFIDLVDEEPEEPDLAEYFSQWDMPWKQQVLICRSYASYLSSRNRTTSAPTPRGASKSAGGKRQRADKSAHGIRSMQMKK